MTHALHAWTKGGVAAFFMSCLASPGVHAASATFDFNAGLGPSFEIVNSGNLFTVATGAGNVRIFKETDTGLFEPTGFISGGIRSNFALGGDFTATVNFTLNNLPQPGSLKLNESVLSTTSVANPNNFALLLHFAETNTFLEGFTSSNGPLNAQVNNVDSGRYRISRTGSVFTGSFAAGASDTFAHVFTSTVTDDPYKLTLSAVQGTNAVGGQRSVTPIDVSFDNLVIEAASINVAAIPEPSTYALMLAGLGFVGFVAHRRRRAQLPDM